MNLVEHVKRLSDLPGVSGGEDAVRQEILCIIGGHCETRTDAIGNLIAFKKGAQTPAKKLMLSAHMDEVGFIITHVEDSGMLRFATVGGIDSRMISGRGVEIGPDRLYGVIGTKAVHHQEESERSEPVKPDRLYIDIGARDKAHALEVVRPGERAVFCSRFAEFGDGMLMGRALDDRVGCALLIELIGKDLPYDCTFVFTVQEETGCTGAVAAGYSVAPDIGIIVETTTAADIAGVSPDRQVCRLGDGPVLSFMDRGTVYDRGLYRLAMQTAEQNGISCQPKQGVYGGNESRSIQTARGGAGVLAVSVPCRYLHSPSCVVKEQDLSATLALLGRMIQAVGSL